MRSIVHQILRFGNSFNQTKSTRCDGTISIAQDILAGFACHVDGSKEITVDGNELKSAVWTKREDIILQPNNFSLTNEMMMRFKEGYDFFK